MRMRNAIRQKWTRETKCTVLVIITKSVSTARHYAIAVYAVVVCLSVCQPVRHEPVIMYRNDYTNRAGFHMGASFDLS